jgi:MFS family permease
MSYQHRRAWWIVAAQFMALFFVFGSGYYAITILVPPLLTEFGWQRAQVGLLFMGLGFASAIGTPVAGWLTDQIQPQLVATGGAVLAGTGFLAASQASKFGSLFAAFTILGMGLGATYVPATLIVSNWFGASRGLALGITMAADPLGGMAMTIAASYATSVAGWRAACLTMAVPMFLVVLPLELLIVRDCPRNVENAGPEAREDLTGLEITEALHNRSFWLIMFSSFFYGFSIYAVLVHLAAYLIGFGYTAQSAALILSIVSGLAGAGQVVMGFLSDRTTTRSTLTMTYCVAAVALLMLLNANRAAATLVAVFLFGLVLTAPISLLPGLVKDCLGLRRFGTLSGFMGFCLTFGASLGPLAAGRIFDLTASYSWSFGMCSLASILAAMATCLTAPVLSWVPD